MEADPFPSERNQLVLIQLFNMFPGNDNFPFVGFSRPASIFKSVDFPEPEVPTMAQNSPLYIVKSTPFKAYTFVSRHGILYINFSPVWRGILSFYLFFADFFPSLFLPYCSAAGLQFSLRLNRNK